MIKNIKNEQRITECQAMKKSKNTRKKDVTAQRARPSKSEGIHGEDSDNTGEPKCIC